jgi:predicted CopG family antitoxin
MAAEEVYQALLKLNSTSNSGLICEYNDQVKKRTRVIIGKPN